MGPEFLTSIEALTVLETPQIVLNWTFDDDLETPLTDGVEWDWISMEIRRSIDRFPEDKAEGDSVLSESFSTSPSVSESDISGLVPLRSHYYSLFFDYREHSASTLSGIDQDISRLGARQSGVLLDKRESLVTGADGVSNGTALFTSAGSTFLTDEVEAGHLLEIDDGGADDGFHRILSVNSETSITLDASLALSVGTIDFEIFKDEERYWISGIDFKRRQVMWRWNADTNLIDFKVDLSAILTSDEPPEAIVFVGDVGGTDSISFVTKKRYVRIPYEQEDIAAIDILNEWDFNQGSTPLTAGFEVVGASYDSPNDRVYLLDRNAAEVISVDEATGLALNVRTDLTGLEEIATGGTDLQGIHFEDDATDILHVGNRNYVYAFDATLTGPTPSSLTAITYIRESLKADIVFRTDEITAVDTYVIVDDEIDRIQEYTQDTQGRGFLWQQPFVADQDTVGLWHLNAGGLLDSSDNANTAVNSGMTSRPTGGRFGGGFEATAATHFINIGAISGEFDGEEGSASVWFKAATSDVLDTGTQYMLSLEVDASNRIRIGISGGSLEFEYVAGGATETVVAAHPSVDTNWHNYKVTWSLGSDEVKFYVDGVQFGATQSGLGTFVGVLATARIGGFSSNTALGFYDECRISDVPRVVPAVEVRTTSANQMYANAGRDYDATFDADDPLKFFYRDEFFTPKFMGGEFLIRNDFEREKLHPPDKNISDRDELIFRGPDPLPILGDLGRLSRYVGLNFDRIADNRSLLSDRLVKRLTDLDHMEDIADTLGLLGFNKDDWNVDMKRRFLNIIPVVHKRGGRFDSYCILAKFLGFYVTKHTLSARRRWDSVILSALDPTVQAIFLDQMGSMDTGDDSFPLALLRFIFYQQSTKAAIGVTSVAASRLLTDAGASFRDTVNVGNLIVIAQGQTDAGDGEDLTEAEYQVVEVHSDTELKVDRNWEAGGNSGVTYYNYWKVPEPDPFTEELLTKFLDIAPDSMLVSRLSDDAVL